MRRTAPALSTRSLLALLALGLSAGAGDATGSKITSTVPMVGGDVAGSGGGTDKVLATSTLPATPSGRTEDIRCRAGAAFAKPRRLPYDGSGRSAGVAQG